MTFLSITGTSLISQARHIAVLFHERESPERLPFYAVNYLARYWREDGIKVHFCFGIDSLVRADILLLHVNLSVVPQAYLDAGKGYPVALNDRVQDIRKSTLSENLLSPGDAWDGPVIVKSDLNYGGIPERLLLGGLREYDSAAMDAAIADFDRRKKDYFNG